MPYSVVITAFFKVIYPKDIRILEFRSSMEDQVSHECLRECDTDTRAALLTSAIHRRYPVLIAMAVHD